MRTLRRRVEGRAAARRVKVGNGVARLHRVRHDAVVDEIERGDVRGLGEGGVGRLGVAEVVVPVEHQVAGNMIEQLRCTGSERVRGIGHRRQHIVLDLDGLSGVARGGHGLGHDKGDRLTDVSHLALRQHRTRRVMARRAVAVDERHQTADVAETVGARVLAGRHEQHAGDAPRRGGVDTLDVRVGHRRAQHERLRRVRQIDVVGVAALPGDETQIFVTPHRLPDSEFHAVSSRPSRHTSHKPERHFPNPVAGKRSNTRGCAGDVCAGALGRHRSPISAFNAPKRALPRRQPQPPLPSGNRLAARCRS